MSTITIAPPEVETTIVDQEARVLDDLHPGWEWKVEPDQLKMRSCSLCVLGQLNTSSVKPELAFTRFIDEVNEAFRNRGLTRQPGAFGGYRDEWATEILRRRQAQ